MAGFLSGLMGALKGMGGGKSGAGLFDAIDPALAGTPAGLARAPGTGGAMPDGGALSDVGDFRLTGNGRGGLMSAIPTAENAYAAPEAPAKKPGFLKRINTPDEATGLSFVERLDRFGRRGQDILEGGDRAKEIDALAASRMAERKNKLLAAQIDQLFGDDPRMAFAMKANPEKAAEALAAIYKSNRETRVVGEGSVVGDASGPAWMAPKYGQADGYGYSVDERGFKWGPQRGPTHQETETGRSNRVDEGLERDQLGVARGHLGVAQGNLGLSRERFNFDRTMKDRDLAGRSMSDPGGGGLSGMSTADLIAALRGAR